MNFAKVERRGVINREGVFVRTNTVIVYATNHMLLNCFLLLIATKVLEHSF